jgi:putative ABC transport system permease protein
VNLPFTFSPQSPLHLHPLSSQTVVSIIPLLLAPLWQNKGRVLISVFAIALGVALGYAVQLINQAAIDEFGRALQTLSGDADLTVRGPRVGFDEALYPKLAGLPEVAVASPLIEVDARIAGQDDPLRIVGLDVFRAAQIQPALLTQTGDFIDTLRADTIFLSPAAREWLGVKQGDTVTLQVGLHDVGLRVAGFLSPDGARQRMAVMDIAGVQQAVGRQGSLTRIDLKLRPGASLVQVERMLKDLLPPGVYAERPVAAVRATTGLTRAYRVNLNVLALVALFTGGLLVFSTQALSVIRRRPQHALLRVIGVTRRGLTSMLLAEGALVGVVGAALGLFLGYALAVVILQTIGADLGAGHFRGLIAAPAIDLFSLIVFFMLGVAVAVLGSLLPALEAARAQPAQALKAGDDARVFERFGAFWPGVVACVLGACATQLPSVAGLPLFGYVAIALLLIGTIMLMPPLIGWLLRALPSTGEISFALARSQLINAPGPATTSLAAIVAAVGLTVSMAIMVASFRQSLEDWLDRVLPADLFLRAGGISDTAYLSPEDQRRIAATPGVRRAEFLRSQQILLDPTRPRVTLLAREINPFDPQATIPLVGPQRALGPNEPPPAWVSELMVDVYGFAPGQRIELPVAGKLVAFTVAGAWRDYARQNGAVLIQRSLYITLTGDANASDGGLWLASGATAAQIEARVRATVIGGERLEFSEPGEIRALSLRIFDRSFAVTYALEAAAMLIGLFGLSSGILGQVLARRREFGMLRHVGMTRRQVGAMLASEGLLASGVGLSVGCVLGWGISLILIHVVNRQSFHWSMELHMPWLPLTVFCAVMLSLATFTATASGRQAMGGDAVRAVKEDW